jgi:hypothetical protein
MSELAEQEERIVLSWVPMVPETKNDCGGKGQQQFTRPTDMVFGWLLHRI